MKAVARFMVASAAARSVAAPGWACGAVTALSSARTARMLRAWLNIRHLREESTFITAWVGDHTRRDVKDHRATLREVVNRPLRQRGRIGIAGAGKGNPCVAHVTCQLNRVSSSADFLRDQDGVLECERDVKAVMRSPLAAVDRRRPVELIHPRVGVCDRLCRTPLRFDDLTTP